MLQWHVRGANDNVRVQVQCKIQVYRGLPKWPGCLVYRVLIWQCLLVQWDEHENQTGLCGGHDTRRCLDSGAKEVGC
jgi:hypothetical protein